MSHVVTIDANGELQIRDLHCLRRAVERFHGVWLEGQTHFKSYFTSDQPKNIRHAIGLPGASASDYQIGVVEKTSGIFSLAYDPYTGTLDRAFGSGLNKLQNGYRAEVLKQAGAALGDIISEQVLPDGTIVIEADTTVRLGV